MQRCKRNVLLKIRHDRFVDDDRPVIFRPAMNYPVTNRQQVEVLGLAQPGGYRGDRRGNVGDLVRRVGFVDASDDRSFLSARSRGRVPIPSI